MSQYCFHGASSLPMCTIHTNDTDRQDGLPAETGRTHWPDKQAGRTDGRTGWTGLFFKASSHAADPMFNIFHRFL